MCEFRFCEMREGRSAAVFIRPRGASGIPGWAKIFQESILSELDIFALQHKPIKGSMRTGSAKNVLHKTKNHPINPRSLNNLSHSIASTDHGLRGACFI